MHLTPLLLLLVGKIDFPGRLSELETCSIFTDLAYSFNGPWLSVLNNGATAEEKAYLYSDFKLIADFILPLLRYDGSNA